MNEQSFQDSAEFLNMAPKAQVKLLIDALVDGHTVCRFELASIRLGSFVSRS